MGEGSIPYRVALTIGYELPFGPGRPLLSSGLAGKVIGGWSIQGITSIQGGPYVTAIMPSDTMGVGSTADFRPNAIQNPNLPTAQRTVQRWFNTSAFVAPPQYTYGNAGRSIVQAPGIFNVDLAVLRFFPITEHSRFELRLEAYDATNHPNFGLPGLGFGTATFGVIGSTLGGSVSAGGTGAGLGRQVQIGARITF